MSDYLELRYNVDRGVWQLARSSVVVSGVIFVSGSDILGVSAPPLPLPQQLVHKSATSSFSILDAHWKSAAKDPY